MNKQELIEALKQLGRGRIDAAETIAELLMPEPKAEVVQLPVVSEPPKKKAT